ncbi:hypothetical protein LCGC14_2210000, partial [marine sediment metagenome]
FRLIIVAFSRLLFLWFLEGVEPRTCEKIPFVGHCYALLCEGI